VADSSIVREGMVVFSSDGYRIGNVLSCDPFTFTVGKGFLLEDYVARCDDVKSVSGSDIRLTLSKGELESVDRRPVQSSGDSGALGWEAFPGTLFGEAEPGPTAGRNDREDEAMRSIGSDEGDRIAYNMGEDPGSIGAWRDEGEG